MRLGKLAVVRDDANIFGSKIRKLQGIVVGSRAKKQYSEEGISWILRIGTAHSAGRLVCLGSIVFIIAWCWLWCKFRCEVLTGAIILNMI